MKKLTLLIVVLLTTLLTGCSSTSENKNQIKPNTSSTNKNEKNTKINKKSNSMQKISDINILGTIKNGQNIIFFFFTKYTPPILTFLPHN